MPENSLLSVENLKVEFETGRGRVVAVDGVNFALDKTETLGIVGESGCGKSVTGLSIMGLLPNNANIEGRIILEGENLLEKSERQMTATRGNKISMIFQEPMTSLNPVFTIQEQLDEVYRKHRGLRSKEVKTKSVEALRMVGIPNPERRIKDYPHNLSGGMRQRAMIAMALACDPDILIADEPTTALDVTIQAQILVLIRKLQQELGTGVIMITHDLGVVAQVAHKVAVMYAGQVVEFASVRDLFAEPLHPYTRGLMNTIPSVARKMEKLDEIKGTVPSLSSLPGGCRFHPRCKDRLDKCSSEVPEMLTRSERSVRCWLCE